MTTPRADPVPSNVTRLLLLAELCRALGGHGRSSYLVASADGAAALRVDRADPARGGLAVVAVERAEGWVYAWEGRWCRVGDPDGLARHLARTVREEGARPAS